MYDDLELSFLKEKKSKPKEIKLSKFKQKPFPHQLEAIKYGLQHNKWLLLDAMGLGKTNSAICLAQCIKNRDKIKHCLIICGINSLKGNWKKEIENFSSLSCTILGQRINRKGKLVIGSIKDRLAHIENGIKEFFIITNIETIRDDKILKALNKLNPEMIIFDEIHKVKDSQSDQGKNLLKLDKAEYKLGMSGTLLLNDPLDLYVPLK